MLPPCFLLNKQTNWSWLIVYFSRTDSGPAGAGPESVWVQKKNEMKGLWWSTGIYIDLIRNPVHVSMDVTSNSTDNKDNSIVDRLMLKFHALLANAKYEFKQYQFDGVR